jgi:hypothetical protein
MGIYLRLFIITDFCMPKAKAAKGQQFLKQVGLCWLATSVTLLMSVLAGRQMTASN